MPRKGTKDKPLARAPVARPLPNPPKPVSWLHGEADPHAQGNSIYEDEPDLVYDFPKSYLKSIQDGVGDWAIYYEPVKAGPRGYFAVAKVAQVIPKPRVEGRYLALIEPGSYLPFDREVPRLQDGRPFEAALTTPLMARPNPAARNNWLCAACQQRIRGHCQAGPAG